MVESAAAALGDAHRVLIEVCVDSPAGAAAAASGGADRVELCSALIVGGLTPSIGTVAETLALAPVDVQVLIRPREGDFVYDRAEVRTMLRNITAVRAQAENASATVGFVIGALDDEGAIDGTITAELVTACEGAPVTFHRAFDLVADLDRSLDQLIQLGVHRVLTGGGTQRATDGLATLAELVRRAGRDIIVMPGGSIRPSNAAQIVAETGAQEIHFRAARTRPNRTAPRTSAVRMSSTRPPDEAVRDDTDALMVQAMAATLRD